MLFLEYFYFLAPVTRQSAALGSTTQKKICFLASRCSPLWVDREKLVSRHSILVFPSGSLDMLTKLNAVVNLPKLYRSHNQPKVRCCRTAPRWPRFNLETQKTIYK